MLLLFSSVSFEDARPSLPSRFAAGPTFPLHPARPPLLSCLLRLPCFAAATRRGLTPRLPFGRTRFVGKFAAVFLCSFCWRWRVKPVTHEMRAIYEVNSGLLLALGAMNEHLSLALRERRKFYHGVRSACDVKVWWCTALVCQLCSVIVAPRR